MVRHGARVCAELAAQVNPALVAGVRERLADEPLPDPDDVRIAVALAGRMVLYATGEER